MALSPALAYYITAHGYGHGVRSCDILKVWRAAYPDVPVVVVSDLPESFLRNRLPGAGVEFRKGSFDVGMVQLDSIRVDVPATVHRVDALYARRAELVSQEARFMEQRGVGLVVADIPGMPLDAARRTGRPCLAVGNFSWDWIYSAFHDLDHRWETASARFAEDYEKADLLLRLPFSGDMSSFRKIEDVGLVAAPGTIRRAELAQLTGAPLDRRWVLLSFTSLEWGDDALRKVETLGDYAFFTVHPLAWKGRNLYEVHRERVPFSDVLASMDAVVSKPGFGLVSECIVNRKPLLYAERTDFIEYPILVDAIETYLAQRHIPAESLYRGELEPYLGQLWTCPEPEARIAADGAATIVARMAQYLEMDGAKR